MKEKARSYTAANRSTSTRHPHRALYASARWRKCRLYFLAANPCCVKCLERGVYEQATIVDHVVPHRGNEALFWRESNWAGLCKSHHGTKSAKERIGSD